MRRKYLLSPKQFKPTDFEELYSPRKRDPLIPFSRRSSPKKKKEEMPIFQSLDEIKLYFKEKLTQLAQNQEDEIKKLTKQWDREQTVASTLDFQNFCFLEGTKIILTDCGNDIYVNSPTKTEEYQCITRCNKKYNAMFKEMIERHEKETSALSAKFQKEVENFRYRHIHEIINKEVNKLSDAYDKAEKKMKNSPRGFKFIPPPAPHSSSPTRRNSFQSCKSPPRRKSAGSISPR